MKVIDLKVWKEQKEDLSIEKCEIKLKNLVESLNRINQLMKELKSDSSYK